MITTPQRYARILDAIRLELSPYPDRLSGSLRDTFGILVALVIAMTLRVPGIALALAILFLTQRGRPGLTLRSSLQIMGGAVLAYAISLAWVQITDGNEVARFLGVVLGIFAAAFCMMATTFPLFFTIFGFYWFLDLAAWDAHNIPRSIVNSGLDNLASLAIVMFCAAGVEYLFGTRHPGEELMREMQKRATALSLLPLDG